MVTHQEELTSVCDRTICLSQGRVVSDTAGGRRSMVSMWFPSHGRRRWKANTLHMAGLKVHALSRTGGCPYLPEHNSCKAKSSCFKKSCRCVQLSTALPLDTVKDWTGQAMSTRSLISTDSPRRGNFSGQPFQFIPLTYSIVDVGSAGEWDLWNDWPEKSGLSLKWNERKPGREQDYRCVVLTKNSELAELLDVIRRHIHVSKLLTRNTRIAVRRRCRYSEFFLIREVIFHSYVT